MEASGDNSHHRPSLGQGSNRAFMTILPFFNIAFQISQSPWAFSVATFCVAYIIWIKCTQVLYGASEYGAFLDPVQFFCRVCHHFCTSRYPIRNSSRMVTFLCSIFVEALHPNVYTARIRNKRRIKRVERSLLLGCNSAKQLRRFDLAGCL